MDRLYIPYMSDYEIAKSYKAAKHKATQLSILAELNGCTRATIKKVIEREKCENKKLKH